MTGTITIRNRSEQSTEINIEGIIGIPEEWQFDQPSDRIATYERFREQVDKLRAVTTPRLIVNIRSTGGNVNDALLILDALTALKSDITTRCYGYVASAATLIAQAASPGKRELSANGLYLIHKSACSSEGNANDLAQTAQMLDKTDERIAAVYAARSGRSAEAFIELMNCNNGNGKWLSPDEAKEAGLIDVILPASPFVNRIRTEHAYTNLTDSPLNIHPNDPPMTIKQHWNAILDLLGLTPTAVTLPLDQDIPAHQEPDNIPPRPTDQNAPVTPVAERYLAEIAALKQQVATLESQNARLQALPTRTKPKEDPSPTESALSGNTLSYLEDLRNFK